MNRIVAIRVRSLQTTEGEPRPTQVFFLNLDGSTELVDLCDQQAEVDFIIGIMPVAWRKLAVGEVIDLAAFTPHHLKWVILKSEDMTKARSEGRITREVPPAKRGGEPGHIVLDEIPTEFIGLKPGDRVVMTFGGAGGLFARDLVEHWEGHDLEVWRVSPYRLKERREAVGLDKDNDVELLAMAFRDHPELFHKMRPIDSATATLSVVLGAWTEAQLQCTRVGNRLAGRVRNTLLRERRAGHPVDTFEMAVEASRANSRLYQNIIEEKKAAEKELAALLDRIAIWGVISRVEGMGVRIGSRVIAATGDIRRFMVEPDLAEQKPLKARLDDLLHAADYQTFKEAMGPAAFVGKNGFERVVTVRQWCLENNSTVAAELLQTALETMKQLGELKRQAEHKGEARFIAYCGLHVLPDGRFARQRSGAKANWNPILRQAFYLLTDQFNRRPDSDWGKRLLQNKAKLRHTHPEVVVVDGKKRYTNGHILKMARWRTATQFARWLYREWVKLERVN